jgi:hypothetical protein|tara:strand:- start:69 stop:515 length:447 start_codon:yes stop_codon:yes gene_type:complete
MKTEGSLTLKYDPIRKKYFPKSLPRELEILDYDFIARSDLLRIETIMWMLFGKVGARRTHNYAQRSEIFESELGLFKIYLEIEKGILEGDFGIFCDGFHKVLNYPILTDRVIDFLKEKNMFLRMESMGFEINPSLKDFIEKRSHGCLV